MIFTVHIAPIFLNTIFYCYQVVEIWDTRQDPSTTAAAVTSSKLGVGAGATVMDMECNQDRIVVACDTKVLQPVAVCACVLLALL